WQKADDKPAGPVRIVCFMTDGYVGNDMAIIDAIKKNAHTTRVFSFGIGNSVNRYLLDGMAWAGRGEAEYVLLKDDADEKVERFARRIQTPVLTDIQVKFSDNLKVEDILPAYIPDLFDVKPLVIHGRYTEPGKGTLTITGNTGIGHYERTLSVDLPASQPEHDTIATLWARTRIEDLMNQDLKAAQQGRFPDNLKQQVIALGEKFQIMSQFTSFVAVEKMRVTIGGKPRLVAVPIEMPDGVSYEGVFGGDSDGDVFAEGEIRKLSDLAARFGRPAPTDKARMLGIPVVVGKTEALSLGAPRSYYLTKEQLGLGVKVVGPAGMGGMGMGGYGGVSAGVPAHSKGVGTRHYFSSRQPSSSAQLSWGFSRRGRAAVGKDDYDWADASISVRNLPSADVCNILEQVIHKRQEGKTSDGKIKVDKDLVGKIVQFLTDLKTNNALDYARKILIPERLALIINQFVADGKIDEAKKLADALVEFDGEFKIGKQMRDVLADKTLEPAERDKRVADLAAEARKPIDTAIREAKLRKRLDERLYKIIQGEELKPSREGITIIDGGVLVSILTSKTDDSMLEALRQAGLKIEATDKAVNLVIGTVTQAKVETIALLDGVRKIDPTELE
ncbi:MAG: hypothetical protein JSV03_13835, partial [Planctomycetota bacterium]